MRKIIENDWQEVLQASFDQTYYQQLREFLKVEYATQKIHPAMDHIYEALKLTPYHEVKVVILGQDPYHGPHQAHSVQPGVRIPPSLRNIYKELQSDLGIAPVSHGYLVPWAQQGILLLNTVLTVREGQAYSHRGKGWERLTDTIIEKLNQRDKPVIFVLWGKPAQQKKALIDTKKHIIIESPHPSPLSASRGFFGSKPFSKINQALIALDETPIDWQLPEKIVQV